jgi:hypothetical protein
LAAPKPPIRNVCAALGYLMIGSAAAVVIWNMVGPLVLTILSAAK